MASFIRFEGVSHTFVADNGNVPALRDIDLEVRENEFVSLVGPSGCGKSTLLNLLASILRPTRGRISIDGSSPEEARQRKLIGFVFQDDALLPWRTALENVRLPLEILRVRGAALRRIPQEMLSLVGLQGFEDKKPPQLSGGMRQRVSLARTLSHDPKVLLMDEPFGALDAITRDKMNFHLLDIFERKRKTVLFVTHSIYEAVLLSDVVYVLSPRPGRIRARLQIDLPRPRVPELRKEAKFPELCEGLRGWLD